MQSEEKRHRKVECLGEGDQMVGGKLPHATRIRGSFRCGENGDGPLFTKVLGQPLHHLRLRQPSSVAGSAQVDRNDLVGSQVAGFFVDHGGYRSTTFNTQVGRPGTGVELDYWS
jgi:hypothetical protein